MTTFDLELIKKTIKDLINLSYETGYIAGKAESGIIIDEEKQRIMIVNRNQTTKLLLKLIGEGE